MPKARLGESLPSGQSLRRPGGGAFVKCLKFGMFFGVARPESSFSQQLIVAPGLALRGHLADEAVENAQQFWSGLRGIEQEALGVQFPEAPVLGPLTPLLEEL